ncbi:MAG: Na+/H+ antiporter NhaC family protein [Gemmatimonadaceae bacterium]
MKLRLPHPFVLLLGGVAVAAVLTWILPAGAYDRVSDAELGRDVVVAGTYHAVPAAPVGLLAALLAVPHGIVAGADVIVTILFAGGTFALLDATGALRRLVGTLVGRARRPRTTVILVSLVFATFGAMENMHEEIIALVPVLVLLSHGLGFGAVTALAMSLGAAVVGSAFGPTNPFGTGIALRFAELPQLSGGGVRLGVLVAAVAVWIAWTLANTRRDDVRLEIATDVVPPATGRDFALLVIAVTPVLIYVAGVLSAGWGFNELSALFLVAGFAIGIVAGRTIADTTTELIRGMETMLGAALFVGTARGISVVLADGRVMDTIVAGLVAPLAHIPALAAAALMVPVHALIHIPVASNSGQAVLTMPIMGPTADLLGFSRDAAVMAYQTGGMMMDLVTPTNGAMLAMLLKGGVSYSRWLRFAVPGMLLVTIVGLVGIVLLL